MNPTDQSNTEWQADVAALRHAVEVYKAVGLFENVATNDAVDAYVDDVRFQLDTRMVREPPSNFWQTIEITKISETGISWLHMSDMADNAEYFELLTECARISRDAFLPRLILELWDPPGQFPPEKISLEFKLLAQEFKFYPEVSGDWLDLGGVINFLNQNCMKNSSMQFEFHDDQLIASV